MRSGGVRRMICYTTFACQSPDFAIKKPPGGGFCVVLAGWRYAYPTYYFIGFCRPGKAEPPPGTTTLTLRRRSPRDSFASSSADLLFSTVQITTAPNRSKTASTANSGLKPIVSASAPTTSANRVLAVQRPSRSGRWRWRLRYDQTRRTRA